MNYKIIKRDEYHYDCYKNDKCVDTFDNSGAARIWLDYKQNKKIKGSK